MSKYAVFTIDVEDFSDSFCVGEGENSISMMDGAYSFLEVLNKHNIKATLFALANRIDEDKELLLQALKEGHSIGLHGNTHEIVSTMNLDDFIANAKEGKEKIERALGIKIHGYRAPGFSIRQEEIDALKDLGFSFDSSVQDYKVSNYGATYDLSSYENKFDSVYEKDGFNVIKMTLSTGRPLKGMPIGGGGYFRMPPHSFVNRVLKKTIKDKDLFVFYCHPFEVSSQKAPSTSKTSLLQKAYLRRGRGKSFIKQIEKTIEALKKEGYEFVSFEELIEKTA